MANLSNINNKFLFTDGDFLKIGNLAPINNISGTESGISITNSNVASITLDNTAASGKKYVMYSDDGGKLNFYDADASSGRLVIDSSGNSTFAGSVRVSNPTQSNYWLYNAAKTNGFLLGRSIGSNDAQDFFIFDTISNSTRLQINSSGNATFGGSISATSTSNTLNLYNNANNDAFRVFRGSLQTLSLWTATNGTILSLSSNTVAGSITLDSRANQDSYINTGGNVGIGYTSPDVKLVMEETPATIVSGNAINGSTMKGIKIRTNLNGDESVGLWFGTNGSHWSGISGQRKNAASTWGTTLSFYTHENYARDLTYARERMIIDSEGNVGIGTDSPQQKLHINGNVRVGTDTGFIDFARPAGAIVGGIGWHTDGYFYVAGHPTAGTGAGNNVRVYGFGALLSLGNPTAGDALTVAVNGNVGIGTNLPQRPLHVNGTEGVARFTSTASGNNGFEVGIGVSSQAFLWLAENSHMEFATNNTERMRITSGGRVLIGPNSSSYSSNDAITHLTGNSSNYVAYFHAEAIYAGAWRYTRFLSSGSSVIAGEINGSTTTSVVYGTTSDYRQKKNIKPLENGLERLSKLKPVKFDWKENDSSAEGFIAHEVQEIFPDAIYGVKDGEKPQGMDYGRITPLLVKAIQELKADNDSLKARIETLENN